jgi:small-conductance mechanosensitive channel
MYCAGMIGTDTLDSVLVHRLVSYRSAALPAVMRLWIGAVTVLAVVVALYELAQVLGWRSPVSDLAVSGTLVAALAFVFISVFVRTRRVTPGRAASPP